MTSLSGVCLNPTEIMKPYYCQYMTEGGEGSKSSSIANSALDEATFERLETHINLAHFQLQLKRESVDTGGVLDCKIRG